MGAKERLRPMLLLNLDMDMDMDTVMVVMDMDIMDTMARDLPMLSQVMDIMVMVMDMDMVMDMAMDTTDKQHQSFLLCRLEFSEKTRNEVEPQGTSHSYHSKIINKLFSEKKK